MSRFIAVLAFGLLCGTVHAELKIHDAWSPEAPPGRTMAGFMEIQNTGESAITLVDGRSPQFGRIEIHDMINDDGVMRMRKLDGLTIEANSTQVLKPGSFHLMLMQPNTTLQAGDAIELVLSDTDGHEYALSLTVRAR